MDDDDADDAGRREGDERRKGDDSGKSAPELPNAASEDGDGDESSSSPSPVSSSRTRDSDASSGLGAGASARGGFRSAQVGAKTRRRRVVFINLADQSLCVHCRNVVPARRRRCAGRRASWRPRRWTILGRRRRFLAARPGRVRAALEGGELASARGGVHASARGAPDWTCLAHARRSTWARWCLRRAVLPYAAHLCVRNNFTTLECATLRGDGDASGGVAKARTKKQLTGIADACDIRARRAVRAEGGETRARKRPAPAVTDVAFRLPRSDTGDGIVGGDVASASSVDVMTRDLGRERGSAVARVLRPGRRRRCRRRRLGEGVHGVAVRRLRAPPGASKRLTVVPPGTPLAPPTPGTWTQLAMDVKSADGESSRSCSSRRPRARRRRPVRRR